MHPVISLKTGKFDIRKERPNPFNPIPGESILIWLRDEVLQPEFPCTEPDAEDWGWYMDVSYNGRTYMVGSCAIDPVFDGRTGIAADIAPDQDIDELYQSIEWIVQFDKHRSLKEKLLGREKMSDDDPFVARIVRAFHAEDSFVDVERIDSP